MQRLPKEKGPVRGGTAPGPGPDAVYGTLFDPCFSLRSQKTSLPPIWNCRGRLFAIVDEIYPKLLDVALDMLGGENTA
jgi:hypothetical protein